VGWYPSPRLVTEALPAAGHSGGSGTGRDGDAGQVQVVPPPGYLWHYWLRHDSANQ
jgi:hypothetical protein